MKLSAAVLAVLAAVVSAQSHFGLVAIRSGSPVQNAAISFSGGRWVIDHSTPFTFSLENGVLADDGGYGDFFTVLSDGSLTNLGSVTSPADADKQWSNENGYLAYKGSQGFAAHVYDEGYYITYTGGNSTTPNADGNYDVALRIQEAGSSSVGSASASASGSAAATSAPKTSATIPVVPAGPGNTTLPQVNGASAATVKIGGVVVAAAAAIALF